MSRIVRDYSSNPRASIIRLKRDESGLISLRLARIEAKMSHYETVSR